VPGELSAPAPAKVNLVLEVLGRRPDGYHEIDTILQTLDLADRVTLRFGGEAGLTVSGPHAAGTPADESNLAWRAATQLAARCGASTDGLHIHLDKQIPAAGGLGGGASDAATTLRLLQQAWPDATDGMVRESAEVIGSDEAFFLLGHTARARGRGERITQLPDLHRHGVVLFIPPDTIAHKTPRMFAALDALPFDDGGVAAAFAARDPGNFTSADVYNSFERVAFDLFDGLAALWEQLEDRVGEPVRLAGAGPTLFWIGHEHRAAVVAAAAQGLACAIVQTTTERR
jgi:4-diphosphocytidyl-2-C-methyl-D-erythritol kinase